MVEIGRTFDADSTTYGEFINEDGQVVVFSQSRAMADPLEQKRQGLLWDRGEWSNLGTMQRPVAINARGQVVGDGPVTIDSTTFTRAWLWKPGLAGLVLWNRLDSQDAVEHRAYSPGGAFGGGSFVPGLSGAAYSAQFYEPGRVSFPKEVVNGPRGAIHFWAKMTGFPASISQGPSPSLIGIRDTAGSYYGLQFNARDPQGNGGLCAAAGRFFTAGTGTGADSDAAQQMAVRSTGAAGWTYVDALGGADPAQWHHYALLWDEDGVLGIGDGTIKVAALVDGKLITQHMQNDPPLQMDAPLDGQLTLLNENMGLLQGSVQFSDLNVWSYARLDAAELPPPQSYLPAIVKGQ